MAHQLLVTDKPNIRPLLVVLRLLAKQCVDMNMVEQESLKTKLIAWNTPVLGP